MPPNPDEPEQQQILKRRIEREKNARLAADRELSRSIKNVKSKRLTQRLKRSLKSAVPRPSIGIF